MREAYGVWALGDDGLVGETVIRAKKEGGESM